MFRMLALALALILVSSPALADTSVVNTVPTTAKVIEPLNDRHPLLTGICGAVKQKTKFAWAPTVNAAKLLWNTKKVKALRGDCAAVRLCAERQVKKASDALAPYAGGANTANALINVGILLRNLAH